MLMLIQIGNSMTKFSGSERLISIALEDIHGQALLLFSSHRKLQLNEKSPTLTDNSNQILMVKKIEECEKQYSQTNFT